jgi:threonine dehydrogenase-like Zn-dependent dehydrogenase
MPRELVAVAPRTPILREYEEPPLGPRQIQINTEFASPKHGTELVAYRDDPAAYRPYDPYWGAAMPRPDDVPPAFPRPLGNMAVGIVTEIGPEATRFRLGERVFGHLSIRETHAVDEANIDPFPSNLSAEAAVCLDPTVMALAIRDAGIKLGDRVAIFGLGAIGLIAVQLARLAGADQVIAVDLIESRRTLACSFGADSALDPLAGDKDAGLAIRELTKPADQALAAITPPPDPYVFGGYRERITQFTNLGVDVASESSGNISALHHAIRATRFGGTVCVLSFYGGDSTALRLGEEFHVNRLNLISARAQSLPLRDAPAWTLARLVETSLRWLTTGRLRTDGIITPIVPFEDSVEAYRKIDEHPEQSIKLGVRFG